ALRARLRAALQRQVKLAAGQSDRAAGLAKEVDSLVGELQQVETLIREASPRYASLTQPQTLDLAEIQKEVLDERTVLLEYFLGERLSVLWAVTRDSVSYFSLPPRAEIESSARKLHALWSGSGPARRTGNAGREAEKLARMVLAPAADAL